MALKLGRTYDTPILPRPIRVDHGCAVLQSELALVIEVRCTIVPARGSPTYGWER